MTTPVETLPPPSQLDRVRDLMRDHKWRSVREIADAIDCGETSASARLRDLRKNEYGEYTIERQYVGAGVFAYRMVDKPPPASVAVFGTIVGVGATPHA